MRRSANVTPQHDQIFRPLSPRESAACNKHTTYAHAEGRIRTHTPPHTHCAFCLSHPHRAEQKFIQGKRASMKRIFEKHLCDSAPACSHSYTGDMIPFSTGEVGVGVGCRTSHSELMTVLILIGQRLPFFAAGERQTIGGMAVLVVRGSKINCWSFFL